MSEGGISARVRWMVLGMLLVQLGWLVAVPPFGGIDEWDHAYRASAVAQGEWVATPSPATRGTGAIVHADADLVAAGRAECESLPYTGPEECVGQYTGDLVGIASGAGRYHPLYYAAVGIPGSVFEGTGALYAMRVVSMLLCLMLMAWSLWSLSRWAGPRPLLAIWCGLTPMVFYSTIVVAPNGLEMAAGMGLWSALAGLAHDPHRENRHLLLAVVSGVLLVTLRSLGPMWAVMILLTSWIAWPTLRARFVEAWRRKRWCFAMGAVVAATGASGWWVISQRSLALGQEVDQPTAFLDRVLTTLPHTAVWVLQMIGAFPYRNEITSPLVYAGVGSVMLLLLLAGARWSTRAPRLALAFAVVPVLVIPFLISIATIDDFGNAWQGRYALPYAIGLALIFGLAWRTRTSEGEIVGPLIPAVLMLVLGHVAGPVTVFGRELEDRSRPIFKSWHLAPDPWQLGIVVAIGVLLAVAPMARQVHQEAKE